jgi:hypothetical protein
MERFIRDSRLVGRMCERWIGRGLFAVIILEFFYNPMIFRMPLLRLHEPQLKEVYIVIFTIKLQTTKSMYTIYCVIKVISIKLKLSY